MSNTMLIPHISCRNASDAVEFYEKAFGATTQMLMKMPDGRVMHASLDIDGNTLYIVDEFPEQGGQGPLSLGGTPVMLCLRVTDCDSVFQRAVDAGCVAVMPLADMFWGDRWGLLSDPFGHKWTVCTAIREVPEEEIRAVMAQAGHCPATEPAGV